MKQQSGFTLMELMVAIAIVAIISAIATPNVLRWVSTQRFNSAARQVKSSIEYMRLFAVKENAQATITFGTDNYTTDKWKRGLGSGASAHEITTQTLPSRITLSSTFPSGLVFNSRGISTNGAGTITITDGHTGTTLNIFVDLTGSSRIG